MPVAEIDPDEDLVYALLSEQFAMVDPVAAAEPLAFLGQGWDNALFRLGETLLVRLPIRELSAPLVTNEARWLPVLEPRLPVAVPSPVFVGSPSSRYPWAWTIVPWIEGKPVAGLEPAKRGGLVDGLAATMLALHDPAPAEAPLNPFRGVPLAERASAVEARWPEVARHVGDTATRRLQLVWAGGIEAAPWPGPPVWVHGDAHPLNLLHVDGLLTGVIDFGDITSGDPANDLATAWWTFRRDDRDRFLARTVGSGRYDDHIAARAAAWAASFLTAVICDEPSRELFAGVIANTLDQFTTE